MNKSTTLFSRSIDRWLVPPKPTDETPTFIKRLHTLKPYQLTLPYIKNNYVYLTFLFIYCLINASLFISRAVEYKDHNGFTIIARACGEWWANRNYDIPDLRIMGDIYIIYPALRVSLIRVASFSLYHSISELYVLCIEKCVYFPCFILQSVWVGKTWTPAKQGC